MLYIWTISWSLSSSSSSSSFSLSLPHHSGSSDADVHYNPGRQLTVSSRLTASVWLPWLRRRRRRSRLGARRLGAPAPGARSRRHFAAGTALQTAGNWSVRSPTGNRCQRAATSADVTQHRPGRGRTGIAPASRCDFRYYCNISWRHLPPGSRPLRFQHIRLTAPLVWDSNIARWRFSIPEHFRLNIAI